LSKEEERREPLEYPLSDLKPSGEGCKGSSSSLLFKLDESEQ
jgi:hypothetical protein